MFSRVHLGEGAGGGGHKEGRKLIARPWEANE